MRVRVSPRPNKAAIRMWVGLEENIDIGGFPIRDARVRTERMRDLLDMFPALKEKRHKKSGTLSGGQQQMLAIARGLMTDPKVLLLDEPSLGLASKIVKDLFACIKDINTQRRTAILLVEHNLRLMMQMVDRAYVLDKGRVVAEGAAREIVASGFLEKVFTGNYDETVEK